jgi:molecular chaperone DnaK
MPIVGIDLGTTYSAVSVVYQGTPYILPNGDERIVPSVVGMSPDGEWLVGTPALNQYTLYPDQTVRSIKRMMGTDHTTLLGGYNLSPQDISGLILRDMKRIAEVNLNTEVSQAVITVPAFFNNAQRRATSEAGALAGLDVVRIINEPTAAALAFGLGREEHVTALVYDLGGGTFDVSLVEIVDGVIDVRASHGDTQLGGDDFDARLAQYLADVFREQHGVDLSDNKIALARLRRAAEAAKIDLSTRKYTWVREEYLADKSGVPLHLEVEISRDKFVSLIHDILLRTTESIERVLHDGEVDKPDAVLLVGGSTHIPAIWEMVAEQTGVQPRQDVPPSEAVALGAAVQAAIIEGQEINAILVDVTPHALGVAVVNYTYTGDPIPDSYKVLIRRNATIPTTVEEVFSTISSDQTSAKIEVYQGDDPVASRNTLLGEFLFDELDSQDDDELIEIAVQFNLTVNGILEVKATERATGRQIGIRVATDRQQVPQPEMRGADVPDEDDVDSEIDEEFEEEVDFLLERAHAFLVENADDEYENVEMLVDQIEAARHDGDTDSVRDEIEQLEQMLEEYTSDGDDEYEGEE